MDQVLGISFGVAQTRWRDRLGSRGGQRKFFVCSGCMTLKDRGVEVVSVPPKVEDRPECYRCGCPLGIYER